MAEVVAKASAAVAVDLAEVASEAVEDKTTEHVKSHAVTNKKKEHLCVPSLVAEARLEHATSRL